MDVRVAARKRGPSGDLTAKTCIGTVATRSWPVPRSHPRKRGPCSTLHRPPQRDATRRIAAFLSAPPRSHPVNGARRRAEEGPLWGSDLADAQRIGGDALTIGSTVASPQAGPLLHVAPILPHAPARPRPPGEELGVRVERCNAVT